MTTLQKTPLILHITIETLAALSFIFQPGTQLPGATREAELILASYGGLLLTTNLVCGVFVARAGFDATAGLVSLCVGTYHAWPMWRAYARLSSRSLRRVAGPSRVLGGPGVHLAVHAVCLVGLVAAGWSAVGMS